MTRDLNFKVLVLLSFLAQTEDLITKKNKKKQKPKTKNQKQSHRENQHNLREHQIMSYFKVMIFFQPQMWCEILAIVYKNFLSPLLLVWFFKAIIVGDTKDHVDPPLPAPPFC
jgi:hypothetical protein